MAGTTPGTEGPTFAPPALPAGWIAQWDGGSQKYYYVQLATGVSQWDVPTEAASTGTPSANVEHPYGTPQPQIITHPDGSQTVKHADGSMEPVMADGTRASGAPSGDRGLGVSNHHQPFPFPSSKPSHIMCFIRDGLLTYTANIYRVWR